MIKQLAVILIFSLITIYFISIIKVKFSSKYFSLRQIIVSENQDITLVGLILTFSPPLIISTFLSFLTAQDKLQTCIAYGFLTSFLIVWPTLFNSRQLLDTRTYKKKNSLYFIYAIYVAIYMLVSYGGYIICSTISSNKVIYEITLPRFLQFYSSLNVLYQNLISNAIWLVIVYVSIFAYKVILKKFVVTTQHL
ncbi:hypothetical protein [Clostridium estertheticum]|uniref:hypothetical protein n=1 Tax=Clostridium estertheticum TaxID=238834 RepID=UPI001CF453CE|nr:hypothetical protein [Clostridium estertheticum]MCB2339100.1 hypothetical protein [Clostridium estertheticum]